MADDVKRAFEKLLDRDVEFELTRGEIMTEGFGNPEQESMKSRQRHPMYHIYDVVLSIGPEQAKAALKECLAIAADKAYLVSDRTFGGNLMAAILCPDHRPQIGTVRPGVFKKMNVTDANAQIIREDIHAAQDQIRHFHSDHTGLAGDFVVQNCPIYNGKDRL